MPPNKGSDPDYLAYRTGVGEFPKSSHAINPGIDIITKSKIASTILDGPMVKISACHSHECRAREIGVRFPVEEFLVPSELR